MREQIKEIINILERGDNLPCGRHCSTGGKIVEFCYDDITNHGQTCMLKQRNLAIQRLKSLLTEAK